MTLAIMPEPRQRYFTNTGAPAAFCKLYTFAAGTSTLKATYQDSAGTVPHANPITLDNKGEAVIYWSGAYKVNLKTATGSQITGYPVDNVTSYDTLIAASDTLLRANLAASTGPTLMGLVRSATGAIVTTLAKWLGWQRPSIFEFMTEAQIADCTSNTAALDAYTAVQAAIDGTTGLLRALNGTYKLSAQPIIRNNCTGIVGEGRYTTIFSKAFNGDLFSCLTNGATLSGFGIAGNGATYTGGGIVPEGYNTTIEKLRINNTADSPIIVKASIGSNTSAATYLHVEDCFLQPTNTSTTYAVRSIGSDDSARPTCRTFTHLSGGSSLVDFSGMNYAVLSDSLGTAVKFSATSGKIHMNNNRLTCQANISILGVDHIIDGNSWGFGTGFALSLDATAANVTFGPGNAISINGVFGQALQLGTTIGSSNPNYVHTELTAYPFEWVGSVTNPTLGNSASTAYYKLSGGLCWATLNLIVGSTATAGSGDYSFRLPFEAFVTAISPILIKTAGGTYYEGVFIVQGGSSLGFVYLSDATTAAWNSATIGFGSGGILNMTIQYVMALT